MMKKHNFKLTTISMTLILTFSHTPLSAQQTSDSVERIEVTGSHIRRSDREGPSPVASLTAEDIANSGAGDLINLFTKLPVSGQGTFSTQGNSSDDTANGGSSVSLRGLGADSTLILVNGRRVSVSPFAKGIDTAFVDINNIPVSAIKRVDILKDGASATYGSDAVAGVINVILKDNFDGFEISAKVGVTADDGGDETNLSAVWGSSDNALSHTFIVDYFQRDQLRRGDRHYSSTANQALLRPGQEGATDNRSSSGFPGTIALASDPTNRMPDTFGNDVCSAADIKGTLCRYDYNPPMTMVPETERFSFNYMGGYELTDNVNAFTELNGQNARSVIFGAASPSFNELFMAGDNPNHPFAGMPEHEFHGQNLTMRRRTVEIGNREKHVDTDYYRIVAGLEGSFDNWDWEMAYSYIKSESSEQGVNGFPNLRRAQEAIDSGLWNPFEPSSNSQQALDFIETTTIRIGKSTNRTLDFALSGPVMDMEHGELMLAIGGEIREEAISDNPDDQYIRGEIFGTEATQAIGSRDNKALFAELGIPVTDAFELQLALRHENYSDFGTTTDPKLAFRWNPSEQWVIRGSYGTAFRAPSLHQLGLGRTDESPELVDTLRCAAIGNVEKACEPQEFTAIFEGNPDLGPEESKSYNLGAIYEISDDFSVSVDYYDYQIENIIDSDTQYVLSNFGNDASVVQRIPTAIPNDPGEIVQIFDSFQNIGNLNTSGLDVDIQYGLDTKVGKVNLSYVMNYVLDFEELRPAADGGQRVNLTEGDYLQPQLRYTFSANWRSDHMGVIVTANYVDEFQGDKPNYDHLTVDAMTTVDVTFNYYGIANTLFTLGIANLTNEEPPFNYGSALGFAADIHSSQGRFTYLKASYTF